MCGFLVGFRPDPAPQGLNAGSSKGLISDTGQNLCSKRVSRDYILYVQEFFLYCSLLYKMGHISWTYSIRECQSIE